MRHGRLVLGLLGVAGTTWGQTGLRERAWNEIRDSIGPHSLLSAAAGSAIQHWRDLPPEWGQGWGAYGVRFGYHMAGHALTNGLEFGAGAVLGEDLRYHRSGQRRIKARIRHSILHTFIARKQDGTATFAYARVLAAYGGGFLSGMWHPPSASGPGHSVLRGTWGIAGSLGTSAFHEFWPDLWRLIRRKL